MSILTAEAVSVARKYCTLPGMKENVKPLADSHEELRGLYDALLAGATAQQIAALMDEADKAGMEIERLTGNLEIILKVVADIGNEAGRRGARITELETRIADFTEFAWQFRMSVAGAEQLDVEGLTPEQAIQKSHDVLLERIDGARVEIERLTKDRDFHKDFAWQLGHPMKSPFCGHCSSLSYTEDGGKNIRCLLCVEAQQSVRIAALEKGRDADKITLAYYRDEFNGVAKSLHDTQKGRDAAIAERDGLRRAIEKARCADNCASRGAWRIVGPCDCWKSRALAAAPAPATRDHRQREVHEWCASAFGADHAASVPQRGVRLLEEAIEACQSAGCDVEMARKLVDYVFSKPAGNLSQELGGVGITLLALAQAAGLSADTEEARELERVRAFPLSHFKARNEIKNAAGFNVGWSAPIEKTPEGENSDHIVEVNKKDSLVCSICGGPAEFWREDGTYRHKGKPWEMLYAAQSFCDKYGYPIKVVAAPALPIEGPRVGSHSPRNVWDGDRQIAYASDEAQAARIVAALTAVQAPRVPGSLAGEGL